MKKLLETLKKDVEIQAMKKEWKERKPSIPFPGYNYDEYGGIDDYKKKIRESLDTTGR